MRDVVEPFHDRTRRLSPSKYCNPESVIGIGEARLEGRWHVGKRSSALRRAHCECNELPVADEWEERGQGPQEEIDPSGHYFGRGFRRPAERHVHAFQPRTETKALDGEVGGTSDAGGGVGHHAWPGFGRGDQII